MLNECEIVLSTRLRLNVKSKQPIILRILPFYNMLSPSENILQSPWIQLYV